MAKLWRFLSISIVVAVCLGLMLVPGLVLHSGNTVYLKIEPATQKVLPGGDFSFNVTVPITASENVSSAEAHIDFDSSRFSVTGIIKGDLTKMLKSEFNNTAGTIDYAGMIDVTATPPETPVTSTFRLCTVNCTAKQLDGTAAVDFVYIAPKRRTAVWSPGAVDYLTNWSAQVVNGTVKVGGPPAISVSPDSLAFNAIEGGENPPDQTLEICNSESGTLNWSLSDNAGWLSEAPTSGSLGEGECEDVTVSVDVAGMEAGDYSATITITGSGEVQVPVSLHIESAMVPIPGGPAGFYASALSISPQQVQPGEEVTISINVANTGGETGSYNAVLYINEVVEGSQTVSVAAGTSENVIFTVSKSQAGVYQVSLAGQSGQFEVVSGGFFGGGLSTGGIIVVVVAVIVLIVGLFLIRRGTRRGT